MKRPQKAEDFRKLLLKNAEVLLSDKLRLKGSENSGKIKK